MAKEEPHKTQYDLDVEADAARREEQEDSAGQKPPLEEQGGGPVDQDPENVTPKEDEG